MFSDIKNFALVFIPINWIITGIVTLILYFSFEGNSVALGYLLGAVTSFLTFGLLMKSTSNIVDAKVSMMKRALTGNVVRMIISITIIAVTYYVDAFNFIATIVGVMLLKIILILFVFIRYTFFKDKEEINSEHN